MKSEEIIIKPKLVFKLIDIDEILRYRELLYIFSWRDIKVRYKQTLIGILWVVFQPLVTMIIFTVFFGNYAKIPSGNLPYSLFVLNGLVFWNFFAGSLSHASNSLVENESIIKKVYFPKIILPLSSVVTAFVDFIINFVILIIFALFLGYPPNIWIVAVFPLAIVVTAITAAGLGLALSSFNVKYRDVRYILPFFIQIMMFLTPVIYSLNIVGERNRFIMSLNPMSSVIESVRFVFSGSGFIDFRLIIVSAISSVLILFGGLWYFRQTEDFLADIV